MEQNKVEKQHGEFAIKKKDYYEKDDIFLSRLASILKIPTGTTKRLFEQRAVSTIRINNLAEDPKKIYSSLKRHGVEMQEVPWSPYTYLISNMDKTDLAQLQEYEKGLFYIQNLSSMLPPILLEPKQNDKILDMCAAPGSKTSLLAALLKNRGHITANDDNYSRIMKLKSVLEMLYVKNTEVTMIPGEKYGWHYPGHFNKILLDAPCSGEGQIYLRGEKPLRFWSIKKAKVMARVQWKLMQSAFEALKIGGTLIYSTCTLEPIENEAILDQLLSKYSNAEIQNIDLFDSPEFKEFKNLAKRGLVEWDQYSYNPEVTKAIRIMPDAKMMGFFVAKITKKKS